MEGKLERRDIIQEFSNFGSQTYAPLTRIGMFLDRGSEQYVVKSRHLSTYQGLLELEASLPDFVVNPRVKAPKPKTVTKTGYMKRKYRQEQELKDMHTVILYDYLIIPYKFLKKKIRRDKIYSFHYMSP